MAMAPALCRTRPPIASANRPSTVRYRPAPITDLVTPGSLSDTVTTGCAMALPMKNEQNEVISATTKISTANTTALAASRTLIRRGRRAARPG